MQQAWLRVCRNRYFTIHGSHWRQLIRKVGVRDCSGGTRIFTSTPKPRPPEIAGNTEFKKPPQYVSKPVAGFLAILKLTTHRPGKGTCSFEPM